ncbi:MAG TPA: tetratricopeptide repeat protein [Sphingomicrobium sp.]|nr:tetratricopeptide repeat protein [Sphingomicrobium sp.]
MSRPLRFAPAFTAVALASAIAGCAVPQFGPRSASNFGGTVDKANIGVATRALVALEARDYATAVKLAERAVENSPNDAGFRALLGNAYFSSGRFASAEAAFRDSLGLINDQPQVILKLALVEIAQGRNGEARAFLDSARGLLEPADYGLAIALAGSPQEGAEVLEGAARQPGADARLRQNLALAYALAGDWTSARTIAAQDLSPDLVDGRIQEWMAFATPAHPSAQVAALTGFRPVDGDPGQPTRLALRSDETRTAEAAPAVEQPLAPEYQPERIAQSPEPEPAAEPAQFADASPAPAPAPVAQPPAAEPQSAASVVAAVAAAVADVPAALAEMAGFAQPEKPKSVTRKVPLRKASLPRAGGNANAVVQLGAYGSRERVAAAWELLTGRYPALRDHSPMIARFDSKNGTVYRLSIKGFDSQKEALARCRALRGNGGSCFVRHVAGDAPISFASR